MNNVVMLFSCKIIFGMWLDLVNNEFRELDAFFIQIVILND